MDIKKISTYLTDAVRNPGRATVKSNGEEKGGTGSVSSDRLQLSRDYRDLAASNTLDVRTERVEEVRDLIGSGDYEIRPDEIASRMVEEVL
ncbi:MAG: flagellar biosynthesis anti-sigma factor FlgM [Desulfobacteraceae bacterium]|nr:flagellar biosynthesis anti-sigma factor FlgM [Desulfobacteraceae bacterium]